MLTQEVENQIRGKSRYSRLFVAIKLYVHTHA